MTNLPNNSQATESPEPTETEHRNDPERAAHYENEAAGPSDETPAGVDNLTDLDAVADTPAGALSPGTTASGSPTSR
ncbi:MAG: hypothetical protein JWQ68_2303 [Cryobacterium sp.]|jgi:hypothetical protein|nr:hypothetical protein [Cryobacterium sp.]